MTIALATTTSAESAHPAPSPLHRVWHYPVDPRCVDVARRDVGAQLRLWKLDELRETAVLVVSELAANAVLASRRARTPDGEGDQTYQTYLVALRLTYRREDLIIEVWDGAASSSVSRVEDLAAGNGHGFRLVSALARDWGYYRETVGGVTNAKVAWAALRHGKPPICVVTDVPAASQDILRHSPSSPPSEDAPVRYVSDRALLQRVIDGLRALDGNPQTTASQL